MDAPKLLAEWFWTDRWTLSSAFRLPLEARGLYREMLTQAWRHGARLPNDHDAIRKVVGCSKQEWARSWPKIAGYWREDGDALVNETQVSIYARAIAKHDRAAARGKKGADGRWTNRDAKRRKRTRSTSIAQAIAKPLPKQCTSNAQAMHKQWPPSPSPSLSLSLESKEHSLSGVRDVSEPSPEAGDDVERGSDINVSAFIAEFCRLYAKHRHQAKYHVTAAKHVPLLRSLLKTYGHERLVKLAAVLLMSDDEWISNTDRGIGILSVKAAWLEDKLAAYEAQKGEPVVR